MVLINFKNTKKENFYFFFQFKINEAFALKPINTQNKKNWNGSEFYFEFIIDHINFLYVHEKLPLLVKQANFMPLLLK